MSLNDKSLVGTFIPKELERHFLFLHFLGKTVIPRTWGDSLVRHGFLEERRLAVNVKNI